MRNVCAVCSNIEYPNLPLAQLVEMVPEGEHLFCSLECAFHSGRYAASAFGIINDDQPIRKSPPKQSWTQTDEEYIKWVKETGGYIPS